MKHAAIISYSRRSCIRILTTSNKIPNQPDRNKQNVFPYNNANVPKTKPNLEKNTKPTQTTRVRHLPACFRVDVRCLVLIIFRKPVSLLGVSHRRRRRPIPGPQVQYSRQSPVERHTWSRKLSLPHRRRRLHRPCRIRSPTRVGTNRPATSPRRPGTRKRLPIGELAESKPVAQTLSP